MKVADIPVSLLTKEQTQTLKLKEEHYLVIVPANLLHKAGITEPDFTFDLIYDKERVSLTVTRKSRREIKPSEVLYNE